MTLFGGTVGAGVLSLPRVSYRHNFSGYEPVWPTARNRINGRSRLDELHLLHYT